MDSPVPIEKCFRLQELAQPLPWPFQKKKGYTKWDTLAATQIEIANQFCEKSIGFKRLPIRKMVSSAC